VEEGQIVKMMKMTLKVMKSKRKMMMQQETHIDLDEKIQNNQILLVLNLMT
jgi:hypothetical protein